MGACCGGEPKTCCGANGGRPTDADECACGFFCLNGPLQLSSAMILTFVGFIFSAVSLGDCAFAEIQFSDECVLPERYLDFPNFVQPTERVGFITFQKPNGQCYWYDRGYNVEDQIRAYFEFLGSDWVLGRGFLGFVCAGALLIFMYMFWFICTAQFKGLRYTVGCVLIIGLTLFQCLSFLVFGDQFCDKCECSFGRSAGFSVGAAVCYFVAGISLFFTKDYPGKERLAAMQDEEKGEDDQAAAAAAAAVSKEDEPVDDEEQAPGGEEGDDDEPEMDVEMGEDEENPEGKDENPEEEEPTASAKAMAAEEDEPAATGEDGPDEETGGAEAEVVAADEEEPAAVDKEDPAANEEAGEIAEDEKEPSPVEVEAAVIEEDEKDVIPPSSATEMMSGEVIDDEVVVAQTETGEAEVVVAADAETGQTEVVMAAGPDEETGKITTSTAPEESFQSAVDTAPIDR